MTCNNNTSYYGIYPSSAFVVNGVYIMFLTYKFTSGPSNNWNTWYTTFKTATTTSYITGNILVNQGGTTSFRLDSGVDWFPQTFIYVHSVNENLGNQMMLTLNSGTSYTMSYSLTATRIA